MMTNYNAFWKRPSSPSAKKVRYDAFLAQHPGLYDALMQQHRISMDLDAKLMSFGSLSPAQIELAFKLHAEVRCPARPRENNVPAPEGRLTVRGTVVSVKEHRGDFGDTFKMTVKVTTDAGTWLCWGTVPSDTTVSKGDEVEFKATVIRGREPHFAFFKRPTNARVIGEETAQEVRPGLAVTVCEQMNAGQH